MDGVFANWHLYHIYDYLFFYHLVAADCWFEKSGEKYPAIISNRKKSVWAEIFALFSDTYKAVSANANGLLLATPFINYKLNVIFSASLSLHNLIAKAIGCFIICFFILYVCYFCVICMINRRYIKFNVK